MRNNFKMNLQLFANTLEYASIFQEELDQQMIEISVTGALELNSDSVKYNGGNEVKIPSIVMGGLTDYDRKTGFKQGAVNLSWETHKLTQDRQQSFILDAMDVDETNFVATAGAVMGEFQRVHVASEIDAYRFSKMADAVTARFLGVTVDNILSGLKADIATIQDKIGQGEELIIYMSYANGALLDLSKETSKSISIVDFKQGDLNLKVNAIDNIPIIKVPSARFKTKWEKVAAGGYKFGTDSKAINWIVLSRRSVICISKTEKLRIFEPDVNQTADAWKIDYRKYHDIFIPKNKKDGIAVNIEGAGA
jgi:hypothetical protein